MVCVCVCVCVSIIQICIMLIVTPSHRVGFYSGLLHKKTRDLPKRPIVIAGFGCCLSESANMHNTGWIVIVFLRVCVCVCVCTRTGISPTSAAQTLVVGHLGKPTC